MELNDFVIEFSKTAKFSIETLVQEITAVRKPYVLRNLALHIK